MKITFSGDVTAFFIPDDATPAQTMLLDAIATPGEKWVLAYAFTNTKMIAALQAAAARGDKIHCYVDRSQTMTGHQRATMEQLVASGVEVTIGTSTHAHAIQHAKALFIESATPFCWEGSVNFSNEGWAEVNTALAFNSPEWSAAFRQSFETLVRFAWMTERAFQLMPGPPPGVAAGALIPPPLPLPPRPVDPTNSHTAGQ